MLNDQINDWCDEVMRRVVELTGDARLNKSPYYEYGMAFHSEAQPVFPRVQWTIDENARISSVVHSFLDTTNNRVNSPGCLYQDLRCKVFDSEHDGNTTTQNILNLTGVILQALITDPDNGGAIRRDESDIQCKWYNKLADGSHSHPNSDCMEISVTAEIPFFPQLYVTASVQAITSSLYFSSSSVDLTMTGSLQQPIVTCFP